MVGFHTTKAKNIRAAAKMCLDDFNGRVPSTLEGLISLPGVGPKMAYLTLTSAFGTHEGLCVDTHVHRIANQLGWIKTETPEDTRKALESWLPRNHWPNANRLLVGLDQQQQQEPHKLVQRCLSNRQPVEALKLLSRIGLALRADKFPE